ncbi:DUF3558 family protein, partial [Saccharopolyspora sp. MS10]|uniref:DUF3558 family protein n=1 Tax=Saccharopolyspora sp. MS10 TaxID=3385973 RepID=UPI00399F02E5
GGGSASGATPSGESEGLESFEPCVFFQPEELTSFGLSTQAKEFTQVSFQPGCSWDGDKFGLALQKNADETVESLRAGAWDEYADVQIAGRRAARVIPVGATGQGVCNVVVPAGEGVALYQLTGFFKDSVADPCGEIEKIAGQTASRLPE